MMLAATETAAPTTDLPPRAPNPDRSGGVTALTRVYRRTPKGVMVRSRL